MHVVDNSDAVRMLGLIRSVGQSGQIHVLPLYCPNSIDVSCHVPFQLGVKVNFEMILFFSGRDT